MVSALNSESSDLGSSPGRGRSGPGHAVFLGKTLLLSRHPGVLMGTDKNNAG